MTGIIIGSFAAFTAGLAQSCLGFGMALIMAPCIMLVIEPQAVVPTVLLMSVANTFLVALRSRHFITWRLLLPLTAGGLVGFSFGLRALLMLDSDNARLVIGLLVLVFTGVLWSGRRWPLPETPWMLAPVGALSGFTGGSTSISGPPVVLFLANQNTPRDVFRANLVCYFFILNCYGIARLLLNGVLNMDVAHYAAMLLPATLLGTFTGLYFGARIPENAFKRAVFTMLIITGSLLIYNGIRAAG